VHEDKERLFLAMLAAPGLFRADAAHGDRIDGFQVARVGDEVDAHLAAFVFVIAGGAHVVLHVAAAEHGARIDVFKVGIDLGGGPANDVPHDGEAAAMAHGHHAFLGAVVRGGLQGFIEQRDQRGVAFERKALGADVKRLQHLLEDVGFDELVENSLAIDGSGCAFEPVDDPSTALRVGNVHELGADGAAINCARSFGVLAFELKLRMLERLKVAERIEIGFEIAPATEKVEDALALFYFRTGFGRRKGLGRQDELLRMRIMT
jgi:hypothetical protein